MRIKWQALCASAILLLLIGHMALIEAHSPKVLDLRAMLELSKPSAFLIGRHEMTTYEGCDDGSPSCCMKTLYEKDYRFGSTGASVKRSVLEKARVPWQDAILAVTGPDNSPKTTTLPYEETIQWDGLKYVALLEKSRRKFDLLGVSIIKHHSVVRV